MRKLGGATLMTLFAGVLFLIVWAGLGGESEGPNVLETARRVGEGTNALRKGAGVAPLRTDPKLQAAAMTYARLMVVEKKVGHGVDRRKPQERVRAAGYEDCMVAENVAYKWSEDGHSTAGLARELLEGWRKSPQDLRVMLHPEAVDTGVAIAHSDDLSHYYAVQLVARHLPCVDPAPG